MAREILFKAKRIDNREWIEGSYLYCKGATTMSFQNEHYILRFDGYGVEYYAIDKDTICQYTGMTDKNGNKIWENDIVEKYYYKFYSNKWSSMCISKILWADYGLNEGWCCKDIKDTSGNLEILNRTGFGKNDSKHCKVIGNIFDNPELLGDGEA